jgi:hypothetical protein
VNRTLNPEPCSSPFALLASQFVFTFGSVFGVRGSRCGAQVADSPAARITSQKPVPESESGTENEELRMENWEPRTEPEHEPRLENIEV